MEKTDKLVAAGCYLPFMSLIVCIFGLIKKASNPFVIYHVRNGIALFLLSFVSIFSFIVPVIGGILWLVLIAIGIYGIYLSVKGLTDFIPVVTFLGKAMPVEKIYTVLTGKPFPSPAPAQPAAPPEQQAPPQNQQSNKQ